MAWEGQHTCIAEKRRKKASGRCWIRLDHTVGWAGVGVPHAPTADVAPPAERRDRPHAGTQAERGKPVGIPRGGTTAQ